MNAPTPVSSSIDYSKLSRLGPFELKDQLMALASSRAERMMLNAGRGNPNFLATTARHGFFHLGLFALFELMDEPGVYKRAVKWIIRRRQAALCRELGINVPHDPNGTDYYTLLDLERIATELHGPAFADWMMAMKEPLEMLFRLADEGGVVLLPDKGFGALHPSARASLANLNEYDYVAIGRVIRALADEYFKEYRATLPTSPAAELAQ